MGIGALTVTIAVATVILLAGRQPAVQAQSGGPAQAAEQKKAAPKQPPKQAPKKKDAGPKADGKKADPKKDASKAQPTPSYAGMPIAERAAIQFDLNWSNHYSGPADGDFSERSVAAVKAFQKDRAFRETGVLSESEPEAVPTSALNQHQRVGWRMVEDRATGAQLGLPTKLPSHEGRGRSGTRWQSAQGQLQIETFRIREPGAT